MPTPLDPSQYQEVPDTQAPSMGGSVSPNGLKPIDPSTVEVLPSYADGSSPNTPVNSSPVSPTDRALLSLGNKKGQIDYLKSKFQDAGQTKDGDLLVQDQGIWHRVDPSNFGAPDAWEATRKIVKAGINATQQAMGVQLGPKSKQNLNDVKGGLASKATSMLGGALDIGGSVLGTAAGTAMAGPAGSVAGAGAGGALGEGLRTSLGRLAGTYEATPEQQAKDIGWEGLLASGGQTVALGVKPAMGMMKNALSKVGDWGTNYSKEMLSYIWGNSTDAGRWATRRAMDDAPAVIGQADKALSAIGLNAQRADAVDYLARGQGQLVNQLASDSKSALQRNYGQNLLQLVKQVPDNFSANVGEMMKSVQQDMVNAGYGTMAGNKFVANSVEDIAKQLGTNSSQVPKILGEDSIDSLRQIARITNQYGQIGSLEGKAGAKQLVDVKKALSESFDNFYGDNTPSSIQRMVGQVKDNMETKIGQSFADHGVGPQYTTMNNQYSKYKDAVDMLNDAVDKGQTDAVVKHLVSKAGSYRTFKDEVGSLASLMGDSGQQIMNKIADMDAAKGFVDFVPKMSGGNSAGTAIKTASTVTGQNNPRIVAKQIQYGSKALDFMKSLPPKQLKSLLSDDSQMSKFVTPLLQAYDGEDQTVQTLLQSSGAVPGGQSNGQQ